MYSQDPKVRRRKVKLRFFTYGVMALATVVFSTLGAFYILGYRLDNSFELERGALVKFDSRPSDAVITVDGTVLDTTPYQANLSSAEHTVSYSREGYQGWQKTVTLKPGEVRWLNYARLLPMSITTTPVEQLESLHQANASPDRQWFLLHQEPTSPVFTLIEVSGDAPEADTLQIPPEVYGGTVSRAPGTFKVTAWSDNGDFFLVRHKTPDGSIDFIRVSRAQPEESINISREFNLELRQVRFASNTPNVVFALDAKRTLHRLDLNNPDQPLMVAKQVSAFDDRSASRVAYISPVLMPSELEKTKPESSKKRSLKIWERDGQTVTELRQVPGDVPVDVSYHEYFNSEYISMVSGNSISVIESPLSTSSKTVLTDTLLFTPTSLSASPGKRFFLAQRGQEVYVYDAELDQSYQFNLPGQKQPLQWLDDHHLAYTGGGNLRLIEFDGTNMQFVTSIKAGTDVMIDTDNDIVLSIGQSAGAPVVQRSFLLNKEDR